MFFLVYQKAIISVSTGEESVQSRYSLVLTMRSTTTDGDSWKGYSRRLSFFS